MDGFVTTLQHAIHRGNNVCLQELSSGVVYVEDINYHSKKVNLTESLPCSVSSDKKGYQSCKYVSLVLAKLASDREILVSRIWARNLSISNISALRKAGGA